MEEFYSSRRDSKWFLLFKKRPTLHGPFFFYIFFFIFSLLSVYDVVCVYSLSERSLVQSKRTQAYEPYRGHADTNGHHHILNVFNSDERDKREEGNLMSRLVGQSREKEERREHEYQHMTDDLILLSTVDGYIHALDIQDANEYQASSTSSNFLPESNSISEYFQNVHPKWSIYTGEPFITSYQNNNFFEKNVINVELGKENSSPHFDSTNPKDIDEDDLSNIGENIVDESFLDYDYDMTSEADEADEDRRVIMIIIRNMRIIIRRRSTMTIRK